MKYKHFDQKLEALNNAFASGAVVETLYSSIDFGTKKVYVDQNLQIEIPTGISNRDVLEALDPGSVTVYDKLLKRLEYAGDSVFGNSIGDYVFYIEKTTVGTRNNSSASVEYFGFTTYSDAIDFIVSMSMFVTGMGELVLFRLIAVAKGKKYTPQNLLVVANHLKKDFVKYGVKVNCGVLEVVG